jgi:hypothetical protein
MAYILRQKTIIAKENSRMPSEELNKLMLDFNLTHSYQTRIYVRIFFLILYVPSLIVVANMDHAAPYAIYYYQCQCLDKSSIIGHCEE